MNKTELIKAVVDQGNMTIKDVTTIVNATLNQITKALSEGEDVALVDFGSFKVKEAGARTGRNPHTGETIVIPAKKKVAFKAGKGLKDIVRD